MTDFSDPDFCQLRKEFLAYIRNLHGKHNFQADPLIFSIEIGLPIHAGSHNLYSTLVGKPILQYNKDETPRRRSFSLWHEICHHIFQTADDGFQALLEEKYGRNTDLSRDLEEHLCDEGAAIFKMPDHYVQEAINQYGFDPRAAIHLSISCESSLEASLRRLADTFDMDSWVLLAKADGVIIYSHTRTKFPFRVNGRLPAGHAIYEVLSYPELLERRTVMPFPNRKPRTPHRMLRAISHENRIIAVIAEKFPPKHDPTALRLFNF